MNWKTLVFLAVAVALLGFVAWRQMGRDATAAIDLDMPLFEPFDADQVDAVVIENLERALQLRAERDPKYGWMIVDPLHVRAERAIFDLIVQSALARRCTLVPEAELDPKKLGLDPPRRVLELEGPVKGVKQRQRVEIGALDVDDKRMHARVRGKIVRVLRDLDTELELPLDEFKSHSVSEIDPRDIVEMHRSGSIVLPDEKVRTDMQLDALAEEGLWRATSPVQAALDPLAMSLLARGSAGLRLDAFIDHGGRSQADLGLDPPELRLVVTAVNGASCALRFGRRGPASPRWNGTVEGEPHVFTVEQNSVYLLATPLEKLLDAQLFRFARAQIDRVELHSAERELELVRGPHGWTVAEARPGSRVFGSAMPADKGRVEDLLGKLEKAEVREFKLDWTFDPAESKDAIFVHAGASEAAALLGSEYVPPTGGRAIRYQRQGDSVMGLVDPDVLAIARTAAKDLWSLKIEDFSEIVAQRMKLGGFSKERRYVRTKGLWMREGGELEARELRPVLDAIFFLRASEHLPAPLDGSPLEKLEDPIRIDLEFEGGEKRWMEIGLVTRGAEKLAAVDFEGRRSLLKRQDLHALLAAILRE